MVWSRLEAREYAYLAELPSALGVVAAEEGVPLHDFSNCARQGCEDSEFVDGFHGGEVVYARIVLDLARTVPWVRNVVDGELQKRVQSRRGQLTL